MTDLMAEAEGGQVRARLRGERGEGSSTGGLVAPGTTGGAMVGAVTVQTGTIRRSLQTLR